MFGLNISHFCSHLSYLPHLRGTGQYRRCTACVCNHCRSIKYLTRKKSGVKGPRERDKVPKMADRTKKIKLMKTRRIRLGKGNFEPADHQSNVLSLQHGQWMCCSLIDWYLGSQFSAEAVKHGRPQEVDLARRRRAYKEASCRCSYNCS